MIGSKRTAALAAVVIAAAIGAAAPGANAQDAVTAAEDEAPESTAESTTAPAPAVSALALDIRTSSLLELAAWCRELGLSESGTKDELAKRLRAHFGLPPPTVETGADAVGASARTVVVESAQGTEYFTLDIVDEEYARLRGGVVVSFKDGDTVHRIKAREILYNRTRNVLSASGDVEYEKKSGDSEESFRGESLVVEVDEWTGVFLDGATEKTRTGEDTAYRFSADLISRAKEEVTVLSDATVTTVSDDDPYWSLAASRIWLLPGSEWAIANAVLKVGEVPVLYIPFFYLPGDELVFHPVLGYRTRAGSYFQTTTYLLGRPKATATTEASIVTMLEGDANEERRREGIFLRRTGKRAPPDDGASLALLADAYANLGYYLGVNASIPKNEIVTKADISMGIAFSRDVYQLDEGYYSPFTDAYPDGRWNEARLFSLDVPFRYRFLSTGSLKLFRLSLSWNLPFYSDPFIGPDFMDRSEDMDWLNILKQGAATEDDTDIDTLGNYDLSLTASFTPDISNLAPFLNTLSITTAKSSLSMRTRTSASYSYPSIERTFFYPEKWTIASVAASIGGKPFGSKKSSTTSPSPTTAAADVESAYGPPRSPWFSSADEDATEAGGEGEEVVESGPYFPSPPTLSQTFTVAGVAGGPTIDIGYSLTPSFSSDVFFNANSWTEAADVRWDSYASVLVVAKNAGKLTFSAASPEDRLSADVALSANAAWQDNPYVNEYSPAFDTAGEREAARLRNYASTNFKSTGEATISFKPFVGDAVWAGTSFDYAIKGLVAQSAFDGTAADPEWQLTFTEWTEEAITAHQASVNFAASVRGKNQSLKLSANIAPRPTELAASALVNVWVATTSASTAVKELEKGGQFQPITITETFNFGTARSVTQSAVWDPEEREFISVSSALNLGAVSATFTAKQSVAYTLDEDSGWAVSDPELKLRPQSFNAAVRLNDTIGPLWKNRVNLKYNLNSSFSFDFQRYTQSTFDVALSATLQVHRFLDVTLSSVSRNAVLFRYVQDLPWFDFPIEIPGEKNPLTDLLDSFNFFDSAKRRSSGYKLNSLSLTAKHYLGDWTVDATYKLSPYLDKTLPIPAYVFASDFSFMVTWTPVPEFKTKSILDRSGFLIE